MKKSFYSILFLLAGLLAGQHVNAQESEVIYSADFTKQSFNDWVPEGDYADQGLWTVTDNTLIAAGNMVESENESLLVSPFIKLADSQNTVEMNYMAFNFTDMAQELHLFIREEGAEWGEVALNYPEYPGPFNTGEMAVPSEYDGKNVQFAFVYCLISLDIKGMWMIDNFTVRGVNGSSSQKEEAGISFDVTEVTCNIDDPDFKAPVINNPNNLKVYYSTDNENVAIANEDGTLIIKGVGQTVVRALTLENETYKKGVASYIIKVVDPNFVFIADFDNDESGFVSETTAETHAWSHSWEGSMMADGYNKVSEKTAFYLVSPEFTLDAIGNQVSFDHKGNYFTNWEEEAQLNIREVGGQWVNIPIEKYPNNAEVYVNSGDLIIPAEFNGKKVQIAFMYSADGSFSSGMWYVDNLLVNKFVPTGIDSIKSETNDNKVYDLQGRMVNNPTKGLYIMNGKKVIIK